MGAIIGDGMATSEAVLMGSKLYREWSEYWPQQSANEPFAQFVNTAPKYVLSTTLSAAEWNNTTVISEDVAARVQQVKDSTEGDIMMSGCATTARWLMVNGLLDELALLMHPIAVGSGQRLFEDTPTQPLDLIHSATLDTGVLHLRYAPAS